MYVMSTYTQIYKSMYSILVVFLPLLLSLP